MQAAGKAQQAAHDAYHTTRGKAGEAYDAAKDTASAAAGKAQTTAGKAYDATKDAAQGAADTAHETAKGAYDATTGAASDAYESLSSTLESYIEWARQKTSATQEEAKRIAEVGLQSAKVWLGKHSLSPHASICIATAYNWVWLFQQLETSMVVSIVVEGRGCGLFLTTVERLWLTPRQPW